MKPPSFLQTALGLLHCADDAAAGVGDVPSVHCWVEAMCAAHKARDLKAMKEALANLEAAAKTARERLAVELTTAAPVPL